MTRRGNRPRTGSSPTLDGSKLGDPRARQSQSAGIDDSMISPPLYINGDGRLAIRLDRRGPLAIRNQGSLDLNVGASLIVVTGSPPRLEAKPVSGSSSLAVSVSSAGADISYSETLVASYLVGGEAPILYNAGGTDIVTSEILR